MVHLLERIVQRKDTFIIIANMQCGVFVVDPDHHLMAGLKIVMHDDRICIILILICKPVITVYRHNKKEDQWSFKRSTDIST